MKPHILHINEEDHENVHHEIVEVINDEVGIGMMIADELAPDHPVVETEVSNLSSSKIILSKIVNWFDVILL